MTNVLLLEKQEEVPAKFPKQIEDFFIKKELSIHLYPIDISSDQEPNNTTIRITSATQYVDYLDEEIKFWSNIDPTKKFETIAYHSRFLSAKKQFEAAKTYINSPSSLESYLNQSINALAPGALSSKTKLAEILIKFSDRSQQFISGFKMGMLINNNSSMSVNPELLQGFGAAMAYRNIYESYSQTSELMIAEFKSHVTEASNNYAKLNEDYTKAFFEQESRLQSIKEQTETHFVNIADKEKAFFDDASGRLSTLEKQYKENLKLKAPAQYWSDMENEYMKKGRFWIVLSALVAVLIVGILICVLIFMPNIFSPDIYWLENIKNSAILTVITSVGIYILRTFIKMAMSSFHLSRDAKERNKLSIFYLALIEDDAVTDKERAIVLNSLFSRADTGLLKGDSGPTMSNNISDLVDLFKNTK